MSHIRNAGKNLHKAHLKRRIAQIEQEQAMADRTATDEIIDVAVATAREGITSLISWGKRVQSSLADYVEEEKAAERRSKFEVIDGERPPLYDAEREWAKGDTMAYVDGVPTRVTAAMTVHHPTVTVVRPIQARSLADARELLEEHLAENGYTIIRHPSAT